VTSKVLRKHLISKHSIKNYTSTKSPNIIEEIPLTIIKGFRNNRTFTFIPKLPILDSTISSPDSNLNSNNILDSNSNSSTTRDLNIYSKIKDFNLEYKSLASSIIFKDNLNSDIDKEATFFNRTTYYYKYLEDKDINILRDLVYLDIKTPSFYNLLFESTIDLGFSLSDNLKNLSLSTRSILNNTKSNSNREVKRFKELYPNTKRAYFREFGYLIIYIYNLGTNYKDLYTLPIIDKDTLEIVRYLSTLENIYNKPRSFYKLEGLTSRIEELILELINSLLAYKLKTSSNSNSTFKNSTITYLIIRALDKDSPKFIRESNIENILSRIIYNTRLYSIGYINYYKEDNNLEDNKNFLEEYINNNLTNVKYYRASYTTEPANFILVLLVYLT
jgi:hypothetical protein